MKKISRKELQKTIVKQEAIIKKLTFEKQYCMGLIDETINQMSQNPFQL